MFLQEKPVKSIVKDELTRQWIPAGGNVEDKTLVINHTMPDHIGICP